MRKPNIYTDDKDRKRKIPKYHAKKPKITGPNQFHSGKQSLKLAKIKTNTISKIPQTGILETRKDELTGKTEELRWIKVSELETKEPYVGKAGSDPYYYLVDKYSKMSGFTAPPIDVFGKRHQKDTYQIINGNHRWLASKKRGDKYILAWITPS